MNKAIAVFDAGLGSYAIVEAIKKAYPLQDIIYFADRKSFPYGTKTTEELKDIIENSIDFLLEKGATFIVLASNAPSITVLDKIKNRKNVIGIYPPLKDVIKDKKKNTLIIGAKVMIDSPELQEYIKKEVGDFYKQFHVENASPLIQLIESGDFINNIEKTEDKKYIHKDSRFLPITEYLKGQDREIELDFSKVEELIGRKLCKSARKYPSYWYASEDRPMGNSIYNAGYDIVKVDVKKEIIRLINYDK